MTSLFAKNEKELETLIEAERIYRDDTGMEFDIKKMCRANNEKQKTNDRKNRTTKLRNHRNARKNENLQILGNIGSGH